MCLALQHPLPFGTILRRVSHTAQRGAAPTEGMQPQPQQCPIHTIVLATSKTGIAGHKPQHGLGIWCWFVHVARWERVARVVLRIDATTHVYGVGFVPGMQLREQDFLIKVGQGCQVVRLALKSAAAMQGRARERGSESAHARRG